MTARNMSGGNASLDSRLTSLMSNRSDNSLKSSLFASVMTSVLCSLNSSNSLGSSNSNIRSSSTLLPLSLHNLIILGNRDIVVTVIVPDISVQALLATTVLDAGNVVRVREGPFTAQVAERIAACEFLNRCRHFWIAAGIMPNWSSGGEETEAEGGEE